MQRIASVVPLGVSHRNLAPATAEDFSFPTASTFFVNMTYIMKNPKHFPHPEDFKPERFLDDNGR